MKKVRCKFHCHSITETLQSVYDQESQSYKTKKVFTPKFQVVTTGNEDDKRFFAATPSGSLEFGTVNIPAFEVGKKYYLDITEAED